MKGAYYYRFWMNMIILHHWNNFLYTQILTLICLVHVKNERAYIGTACCFVLFTYSCEKNMLKTYLKQLQIVEFVCRSEIVYFRASVLLVLLTCILFHVSALLLFFYFLFLYKNLHNCFGHLNIPRSLFISL